MLIVGPPGIGRQHIARTIHSASQSKGAFTPISCSALPPDLLRSSIESIGGRRMPAEEKSPATVVLLDVDQLPAELQHELAQRMANGLRNVRIMATSAERLDLLAERSEFRGDLAQLLGTLVVELPPLASRPDDIPHFGANVCGRFECSGQSAASRLHVRSNGSPGGVRLAWANR